MKKGLTIFIAVLLCGLAVGYATLGRQASEVRVLRLGHGLNTDHPVHKTMEFLARRVQEKSNGRLVIQIFPGEQLGNEKECIEALQLGYMSMTKTSTAVLEGFVPRLRIFGIPYLFRDGEHFWRVALGPIGKELLEAGRPKGLKGLCYYDAGARSFYAKKPIRTPADIKGWKIRVQNSAMSVEMIQAMGGSATPMPWGELYTSLDQGVVDAAENNPPSFGTSRHYEICKYYCMDEHLRLPDMLLMSTRVWDGLPPDLQQVLQEAVDASVVENRRLWAESEQEWMDKVRAEGVEVISPDKRPFQEAVQSMWQRYQDGELGDLIRRIQEVP